MANISGGQRWAIRFRDSGLHMCKRFFVSLDAQVAHHTRTRTQSLYSNLSISLKYTLAYTRQKKRLDITHTYARTHTHANMHSINARYTYLHARGVGKEEQDSCMSSHNHPHAQLHSRVHTHLPKDNQPQTLTHTCMGRGRREDSGYADGSCCLEEFKPSIHIYQFLWYHS